MEFGEPISSDRLVSYEIILLNKGNGKTNTFQYLTETVTDNTLCFHQVDVAYSLKGRTVEKKFKKYLPKLAPFDENVKPS